MNHFTEVFSFWRPSPRFRPSVQRVPACGHWSMPHLRRASDRSSASSGARIRCSNRSQVSQLWGANSDYISLTQYNFNYTTGTIGTKVKESSGYAYTYLKASSVRVQLSYRAGKRVTCLNALTISPYQSLTYPLGPATQRGGGEGR